MSMKTEIIFIDDRLGPVDPLLDDIKKYGFETLVFNDSPEALQYIMQHLEKRIIVVLDLNLFPNQPDGRKVLQEIRKHTFLIPVIIWTGKDEHEIEKFSDFINNDAFAFTKRDMDDYNELIEKIKQAELSLSLQVGPALEEWINLHSEEMKNIPYIFSRNGKTYTLNELLQEIRMQTEFGKQMEKNILMLTIDLLARNKERLK